MGRAERAILRSAFRVIEGQGQALIVLFRVPRPTTCADTGSPVPHLRGGESTAGEIARRCS